MHPAVSKSGEPALIPPELLQAVWQQILLASSSNIFRIQPPYSKATVNTLGPYLWTYFLISALTSCNLLSTQCPECKCLEVRSHQSPPMTSHLPQNECQKFLLLYHVRYPHPNDLFSHELHWPQWFPKHTRHTHKPMSPQPGVLPPQRLASLPLCQIGPSGGVSLGHVSQSTLPPSSFISPTWFSCSFT